MREAGQIFIDHSRQLLMQDYLPKLARCIAEMSAEVLWWRPNDRSNAVGNLLLHLSGNVRQWIIHGIGGAKCTRIREKEFTATGSIKKQTLLRRLHDTCAEADAVLSSLDPRCLADSRTIQGIEVSVLSAIYHALEHFSGHLGQIIYITKLHSGEDLCFWVIGEHGTVERGWTVS